MATKKTQTSNPQEKAINQKQGPRIGNTGKSKIFLKNDENIMIIPFQKMHLPSSLIKLNLICPNIRILKAANNLNKTSFNISNSEKFKIYALFKIRQI